MINRATLLGRIGKKDFKDLKNGGHMCALSIATSRKYIDSQGQTQEQTTWHNVNFFNKLAEVGNKYAHVGDLIYVEGEISNKKIDDGSGGTKYVYSIVGSQMQFIPTGKKREDQAQESPAKAAQWDDGQDDGSIPF